MNRFSRGVRAVISLILALGVALGAGVVLAAPGQAVDGTPTPSPSGAPQTSAPTDTSTGRTANAGPSVFKIGDSVLVSGSGWPALGLVTASVCGNNFLNGSVDCNLVSAGQTTANSNGTFGLQVIPAAFPPVPCPCVVHVATDKDANTVNIPVDVVGAPQAPPSRTLSTRSVDVSATITGNGPLSAYFGGAAKRELVLNVTNTGAEALTNPPLVLTFGKGQDPTTPLPTPDGLPPALGYIGPGSTVEYRLPITIGAVAFGQYRVKGQFIGLDAVTVNNEQQLPGTLTFTAATSTYPWILIVLAWLLLQIPLLGLYKRRPVAVEPFDEDPLFDELPVAGATPGFAGGLFDPAGTDPGLVTAAAAGLGAAAVVGAVAAGATGTGAPPPPPGYQTVGPVAPVMPVAPVAQPVAVPVPVIPQSLPPMPPVAAAAPPLPPVVAPVPAPQPPAAAPATAEVASSVFGVDDLRSMMQPGTAAAPLGDVAADTIPPVTPAAPASQGVDALRSLLQPPQQ